LQAAYEAIGGFVLALLAKDLDEGGSLVDRALVLNPNLATAWTFSGWVRIYLGEPEAALDHLTHALRLSPRDPMMFWMQIATLYAHFFAGRYEQASSWAEKAMREEPNYLPSAVMAAASAALAGRSAEAQKAIARVRQIEPASRISNLKDRIPFRRPEDLAR
jgi:tetratricopeptide (TPR) repeat protein